MAATTNVTFVVLNGDTTVSNGNLSGGGASQPQSMNFDANDVIVTITICIIIVSLGMGFLVRTYCLKSRLRQARRSVRSNSTSSQQDQPQPLNDTNEDSSYNTAASSEPENVTEESNSVPQSPSSPPHRLPAYLGNSNLNFDSSYDPPPPTVWFTMPPSYEDAIKYSSPYPQKSHVISNSIAALAKESDDANHPKCSPKTSVDSSSTPAAILASSSDAVLPSYDSLMSCQSPASQSSGVSGNNTNLSRRTSSNSNSDRCVSPERDVGIMLNHHYSSVDVDDLVAASSINTAFEREEEEENSSATSSSSTHRMRTY